MYILFKSVESAFYFDYKYSRTFVNICYILIILEMLEKKQLRAIFLFEFKRGRKAAEATRNINEAFGQNTVNERWFVRFRSGNESLEDEEPGSRPSEVDDDQL